MMRIINRRNMTKDGFIKAVAIALILISILVLGSFSLAFTEIPPHINQIDYVLDQLIDENGDGLAEFLRITLDVYGSEDLFSWYATLYGLNEEFVASFDGYFEIVENGYAQITIDLDGMDISQSAVDGPYTIDFIAGDIAPYYDTFLTSTYSANDFAGGMLQVAIPIATTRSGTYSSPQLVALTCDTIGANILYSIDGSSPSLQYSNPISISSIGTTTLKIQASMSGMANSSIATYIYNITTNTYNLEEEPPFRFIIIKNDDETAMLVCSMLIEGEFELYIGKDGTSDSLLVTDDFPFCVDLGDEYVFSFKFIYDEIRYTYNGYVSVIEIDDKVKLETRDVVVNTMLEDENMPSPVPGITRWESGNNNTMSNANQTFNDDDMYGYISPSGDVDWFVVTFPISGYTNFWLGVPSGRNYDLYLYSSAGSLLGFSERGTGIDELITYYASANTKYYMKVTGYQGANSSSLYYQLRTRNAASATYTASYYGNSNTSGSAPSSHTWLSGGSIILKTNTGNLARTGYTFVGWNTNANGRGKAYLAGSTHNLPNNSMPFYAQWRQNTVTLTASNPSATIYVTTGSHGRVPIQITAPSGGNVIIKSSNCTSGTDPALYDSSGNRIADDEAGRPHFSYPIPAGTTRTVYAGEYYAEGSTYTITATFPAVTTYTATYYGNSNTSGSAPPSQTWTAGSSLALRTNTGNLARTGYTFAGWNTLANGRGTAYLAGSSHVLPNSNISLYAQWRQNTVTLTAGNTSATVYVTAGSQGRVPIQVTAPPNGSVTIKSSNCTSGTDPALYDSAGNKIADDQAGYPHWLYVIPAGTTQTVYAGEYSKNGTTYTITATFPAATTYTATYYGNSNTSGSAPASQTWIAGNSLALRTNTGNLARTGYTFAGWNTASNGSGTPYLAGSTHTLPNANISLYAQWRQNTVTLTSSNPSATIYVTAASQGRVPIQITAPSNGSVTIKSSNLITPLNLSSDPVLFDSLGNRLSDDEGGYPHWLYVIPANTTRTFYAGTYSHGQATYNVTATFPDPFAGAINFDLNNYNGLHGSLSAGKWVYYKFTTTVPGIYTIQTKNATFDTYGYLYSSNKVLIGEDDDHGIGNNFRISYKITSPGTYYVAVKGWSSSASGSYDLLVNFNAKNKREIAMFQFGNDKYYTTINNMEQAFRSQGYTTSIKKHNVNFPNTVVTGLDIALYGHSTDILLLLGHGRWFAGMPILTHTDMTWQQPAEYLCAKWSAIPQIERNNAGNNYTEIGVDFKSGSTTKTNSLWNGALSWGVWFPCGQLTYGLNNVIGNLDSSQVWARAMLGDGNRMHGILGYANLAPANTDNISVRFLNNVDTKTLINTWKTANEFILGDSDWAAIAHRDNVADTAIFMHGSTNNGDSYIIDRYSWRGNQSGLIIRSASPYVTIAENEDTFNFQLYDWDNYYSSVTAGYIPRSYGLALTETELLEVLSCGITGDEEITLEILDNETISFENGNNDFAVLAEPIVSDDESAVEYAVQLLESAMLMPEDDYIISVSEVIRQVIETDTNLTDDAEVMAYDVKILHTFNDKPVFSEEREGIYLTITNSGLSSLSYKWTDFNSVSTTVPLVANYSQLFSQYSGDFTTLWNSAVFSHNIYVSDAFYLQNGVLMDMALFDNGNLGFNRVGFILESQEWVQ